jgi:hypothetical protein
MRADRVGRTLQSAAVAWRSFLFLGEMLIAERQI